MSNLGRFLPLSQKQVGDESAVSGDWSVVIADCLDRIVALLGSLDEQGWDAPAAPDGRPVRVLIAELIERCDAAARPTLGGILTRSLSNDAVGLPDAAPDTALLVGRLGAASVALRTTGRRRILRPGVGLLSRTVVTGYDISSATERAIVFPPLATGAVALARATAAPTPIRAVIRGRMIVATDDGWSFGSGPRLPGSARELVLFLFGRSDRVPGG